jgi:hypothetical protein
MAPTTTLWYRHRGPHMTFKSNQQCIVGCIYMHLKKIIMAPTTMMYVLFRTRNLGQHFLDSSKKNYVNQPLVSLINVNY